MNKIITQIGSLPYREVWNAVEYSLRHDIPFLPELTNLGERMLDYIKKPGNLSCLDLFKRRINERGDDTVKVQCVGPVTLHRQGEYSLEDAVSRCRDHIAAILEGINARYKILFLDEPALNLADNIDYRDLWNKIFYGYDVIRGVHCCGMDTKKERGSEVKVVRWKDFFSADLDVLSFPHGVRVHSGFASYRESKRIAWGIEKRSSHIDKFRDGDLLTPPCGLAMFSVEHCERTLDDLLFVKRKVLASQKGI